jgi:hypothetical protein
MPGDSEQGGWPVDGDVIDALQDHGVEVVVGNLNDP